MRRSPARKTAERRWHAGLRRRRLRVSPLVD
jgi:hypothetical protein